MDDPPNAVTPAWNEEDSQTFIDLGRYYVPEREAQIDAICDLLPPTPGPFTVLELCCGEGLLARALLARYPQCRVVGLDGSLAMLQRAAQALAPFGGRFRTAHFDLADYEWRTPEGQYQAIVSSLGIHHLDSAQKQALYRNLFTMLATGGALIIADVIQPASELGSQLAANAWDAAVHRRALELDGNPAVYARFQAERWNLYRYPDEIDKPSPLIDQLKWLEAAGFEHVDVYWLKAGHAIFGGQKDP
jgi:tRNA (cmo5U34)-methyltransferase